MKRCAFAVAAVLFVLCTSSLFAQTDPVSPPSIDTDKNAYAPGEVLTIVGDGWTAGETVTIQLDPAGNNRTPYTLHSTADDAGHFVNQDYTALETDSGTHYVATATGTVTTSAASAQFTITGKPIETGKPDVQHMEKGGHDKNLNDLPDIPARPGFEPVRRTRHPRPPTDAEEQEAEDISAAGGLPSTPLQAFLDAPRWAIASLATPPPSQSFDGISSAISGCGCLPPDTDGDVGPNHYIQSVNSGIRVFNKTGTPLTSFVTYNAFFAPMGNSTPCGNSQNDGDGVVFYDSLADRWVVSDFAFPGFPGTSFWQCIGVSKTPNPVAGGWWLYAIRVDPTNPAFLGDYPKFGLWHNAYYLTMNMFINNTTFNGVRVYALDRASMLNGGGAPTPAAIGFTILPATLGDAYSLVPATFRYGAPPPNRDEYLLAINSPSDGSIQQNSIFAWRFHPDFGNPASSTFGAGVTHAPNATISVAPFYDAFTATTNLIVPQTGTTAKLDTLGDKLMYPLYYQNLNGVESLWATGTVNNNLNGSGPTAIRWYQFDVTGGGIPATPVQQQTFNNNNDGVWRWMPSLGLDSNGNLAITYTASSAALNPSIRYAGRLSNDAPGDLAQGEALLVQGAGHQTSSSGRWGDYSAMGVDVSDGCTFWHTNEYFSATSTSAWNTRIGSFKFATCNAPTGILQGTVTTTGGAPVGGATVTAGSSSVLTDANGVYQFTIAIGSYNMSANAPGYLPASATEIAVTTGATTTRNFNLNGAATFGCITDTSQADFQNGASNGVDVNASPGDVSLAIAPGGTNNLTQTSLGTSGSAVTTTIWEGQTFVPTVGGGLTQLDVAMFCSTCTVTGGPVTVEIRNVNGTAPGNNVLATATIPGFSSGASTFYSAIFSTPPRLTAGTAYAFTLRGAAIVGTYAATRSTTNVYTSGAQFISQTGGVTWGAAQTTDLGFRTFMSSALQTSGTFTSSVKDSNPVAGNTPAWGTLSWTATTPAGTSVALQAAASNSASGPFNFVGPDGTSGSSFTSSGASLSQFNGFRYLEYKAFLAATAANTSPVLSDVSICFDDRLTTSLTVTPSTGEYGGTTTLSATLTSGGSPVASKSIAFTFNGSPAGNASTDASGVATISGVSLAGITAGSHPGVVSAAFTADTFYLGTTASGDLNVATKPASVTPAPSGKIFGTVDPPLGGTLTGFLPSDGVTATYSRTPGETVAGNPYTISATLSPEAVLTNYTIAYNTAPFTIGATSALIAINDYSGVYDGLAHGVTGTATGVGGEDLSAFLNFGETFSAVPGGTAHWSFGGNANYVPASGTASVTITQSVLTVTANSAARMYSYPNPPFSATITGFKNGETLATSGVTGSAALSTTATLTSAPGPYPIHAALGTLAANNYSFTFVDGTLNVFVSGLVGLDSVFIGSTKAVVDSFSSTGGGYPASAGNNALVLSNGLITVSGAKIGGTLLSALGAVVLGPNSNVTGDVIAATTITNQGTVGGALQPNHPSGAITANPVTACSAFTLNPAITGKYTYLNGDLTIASNATVRIANGSYCFHNVTLAGNASVQVSGPVVINLTGVLNAGGGAFVNTTLSPANMQISSSYAGPAGVTIGGNASAYLTVYAPATDVTVTGGSPVFGALFGKTLTISGNSQAHYDVQNPGF